MNTNEISSCQIIMSRTLASFQAYLVRNVRYLESKNNHPNNGQNQALIAIHYVFCSNTLQLHLKQIKLE